MGTGFIIILSSSSHMASFLPFSRPSFLLILAGIVTCPFLVMVTSMVFSLVGIAIIDVL